RAGAVGRLAALARLALRLVLAGVIGDVPAGPLELDRGGGEQLLDRPATALRAGRDGRVRELLNHLELVLTRVAAVFVEWHGASCSNRTSYATSWARGQIRGQGLEVGT